MLIELRVRNLAVIEDLSLELRPGLNVLSGETGAGKSLIVGALALLLGERASSESVRIGADRAVVEAVFDLSASPEVIEQVDALGYGVDERLLLLRREVQPQGRNRAWINGSPATVGAIGDCGRRLVDLHGQHEHQALLAPAEQRRILDAYAGATDLAAEVGALYERLSALRTEWTDLEGRRRELETQADFLRFQLQELRDADLQPGEDAEVHAELQRLEHAEDLARDSEQVHRLLYGADGSASEQIARSRDVLRRLARIDPALEGLLDQAEDVYHRVVEVGRSAGSYASGLDLSPERTHELRERADLQFRLKRKYGPELSDVIATRDRLEAELQELEGAEFREGELERQVHEAAADLEGRAAQLTGLRAEAGRRLARQVEDILPALGMPEARFEVEMQPLEALEAGGAERVRFLASLNPGFDPQPISRIASGGELSRVMLALKSILAQEDRVTTLVFDEIDAGIGGTVAVAVARKLREVARHHQVFVITHLAQLASQGDQHLRVMKEEQDGLPRTTVLSLEGEARIEEISRMLGGDPDSETSRNHARELMATGGPAAPPSGHASGASPT